MSVFSINANLTVFYPTYTLKDSESTEDQLSLDEVICSDFLYV